MSYFSSIPRQLPDMKNVSGNGGPSIFRTTPIAALIHSIGYDVEHCIPIGSLKWSYYDGGIRLLGVSDAGLFFFFIFNRINSKNTLQ
jgi:hypothetical protein